VSERPSNKLSVLAEVVSQATISKRQAFLSKDDYAALYAAAEKQSKMLSGLKRSLEERID